MLDRSDLPVVTPAITAPMWAPVLQQVNAILTMASLVLGIAFLIWKWRRAAKTGNTEDV